jgi:hypothetical protein
VRRQVLSVFPTEASPDCHSIFFLLSRRGSNGPPLCVAAPPAAPSALTSVTLWDPRRLARSSSLRSVAMLLLCCYDWLLIYLATGLLRA